MAFSGWEGIGGGIGVLVFPLLAYLIASQVHCCELGLKVMGGGGLLCLMNWCTWIYPLHHTYKCVCVCECVCVCVCVCVCAIMA